MSTATFNKSFTRQEPIPESGIERAVEIMRSGKLHRYNTDEGESADAALLEGDFAAYLGADYCLACASGGYALHIALKVAGLKPGDQVLTNAFTLAPVPGAIDNAGGIPVLVEIDENYCVDLAHLEHMMQSSNARYFMISHMRGHLADMNAVVSLCEQYDVTLIEDCAHTMGASWRGQASGTFGKVACFSTQTYKHINSGEGGLLTTNDELIIAKAIMHSGSYMLYERHGAAPDKEFFENIRLDTPNYSGRLDNLRAAILRSQLPLLENNCARWNTLYTKAEAGLNKINSVELPQRPPEEHFVGSSIQFRPTALHTPEQVLSFVSGCLKRGVELKWFGNADPQGFTSRFDSWRYLGTAPELPNTLRILSNTLDMRIPLTFEEPDMQTITDIIENELHAVISAQ